MKGTSRPRCNRIPVALFTLAVSINAPAQVNIGWHSIDGGGGISREAISEIELIGVIGQSDTLRMSAGNLSLSGGYLPLPADPGSVFKDGFE